MFKQATIYATADIQPYNTNGYDIKLIGSVAGNTTDDGTLQGLILRTDGNVGAHIYAEVTHNYGLQYSEIYAKDASSVHIYCHDGGNCNNVMIECPENNTNPNNSCTIYCDDDPETNCTSMQVYTTNGYCKDVAASFLHYNQKITNRVQIH